MNKQSLPSSYFSSLLPELATRAARATVSRLGFSNTPLRQHLGELFSANLGEPGCFIGEPVFEATFGWETADRTMESLAPSLLNPKLMEALDKPAGQNAANYRFSKESLPYKHQLESWQILANPAPQSVIVTSGTGSGKTECFMVPILNQLANEIDQTPGALMGVRALFLYPLNALIQSQQERLQAWTGPFNGDIRFCLYNGQTQDKQPQHLRNATPHQVIDRETLRATPPPILVTNATMLEYMLVRSQDAPILQKSEGMLRWIVLDEAHSYIGSQAAELALLIRRVLHGFGVKSSDVRFVATSATIGNPKGEAGQKLRDFLAGLAGVSNDRVHVVSGSRAVPNLTVEDSGYSTASLETLEKVEDGGQSELYSALGGNLIARRIRELFVPEQGGKAANPLSAVCALLPNPGLAGNAATKSVALRWLDLLTRSRSVQGKEVLPFLPLRLHAFHNVLGGLWACSNRACTCRSGTKLDSADWYFGTVYTEQRETCACGSPVYELRTCNDCNDTFLWAVRTKQPTDVFYRLSQEADQLQDDFQLESETDEGSHDVDMADAVDSTDEPTSFVLIANQYIEGTAALNVELKSQLIDKPDAPNSIVLRVRDEDDGLMTCPGCGGHHGNGKLMFRASRLGAPFLMLQSIPTLMEFCPDGESPNTKPMRGRRLITFTDSRQGTARIAATLQRDAERNSLRSLVYQCTSAEAEDSQSSTKSEVLIGQIHHLKALNNPALLPSIVLFEQQLSELQEPKVYSFDEIAEKLSQHESDINKWALNYYRDISPDLFEGDWGGLELARLFLVREFSNRPKRANSLETMGMVSVQYPKLQKVTAVPAQVMMVTNFTPDEWRQLLKTAVDFVVRDFTAIELKESWRKWIGKKARTSHLLPPLTNREEKSSFLKIWPQSNRVGMQNRMVRLLAVLLRKDPGTGEGRDAIDAVLRALWDDLVRIELLQKSNEGRFLALKDIAFASMESGWLCPVTRRVLDVAVRGVTPYLPSHNRSESTIQCQKIEIPKWPQRMADFASPIERIVAARQWLSQDPQIVALREQGIWSNLNDRIVEGVRYFRTAEHSAQQSGSKLKEYEDRFKEGQINLLSCSTTMEMGVDIGGISVVAMNNVPPHPANYLQRAGRAGRRSETRSVALTVCKNNPHDQMVFLKPMWPFVTALPAPTIKLESPVIVQRHFNAMMLSNFLWRNVQSGGDLNKLNMEWWALPKAGSRVAAFVAWCRCFDASQDTKFSAGLQMLLRHTCFDGGVPLASLAQQSGEAMEQTLANWYAELLAVNTQLGEFTTQKDNSPAFRALTIQKKRLTDEYLLRELASGGFLPGYGFPTNIVSFDMLNVDELKRQEQKARYQQKTSLGREDNKMRHRELPSRDAVTALREYAPGAEVVMDGQVYRSAGITLNWHAPASESQVKQIQSIRQAWRCTHCGTSGTFITSDGLGTCQACGEELPSAGPNRFTYIEPAGFAVDLYESSHTDVTSQAFVPVAQAWINAEGDWLPLPNPVLGSFRSTSVGKVFNHSGGAYGGGYAICLDCGRAEPMHRGAELPSSLNGKSPHKRLRGAQGGATKECGGSYKPYSVKPSLHLGLESVTDVLELQLNGIDGIPLSNPVAAYSLAVAIRHALAASLGVEIEEIGCDTKPIRHPVKGVGYVIVLYDHSAAGYCSSVADRIPELLRAARKQLECPSQCQRVCQHCLLSYDTRFRIEAMDRLATLQFLTDEWLKHLQLQKEDALFGIPESYAESQTLVEAITREWDRPGAAELRLHLQGSVQDWDFAASPIKRFVQRWCLRGPVKLILPKGAEATLSSDQRYAIAQLSQWDGVTLHLGSSAAGSVVTPIAEVVGPQGATVWASRDAPCATPGADWGRSTEIVLVRGRKSSVESIGERLEIAVALPADLSVNAGRLEFRAELNGLAEKFGARLLERLELATEGALLGDDNIKTVIYQDRYLNSPLPVMLLVSFIAAMKTKYSQRWDNPLIEIVAVEVPVDNRGFQSPTQVSHNWPSSPVRDAAITAAFSYRGMDSVVRNMPKPMASHARMLELRTNQGKKLKVWFDQGFGYWVVPRSAGRSSMGQQTRFQFNEPVSFQGEDIGEGKVLVEGQTFATQIFFEKS